MTVPTRLRVTTGAMTLLVVVSWLVWPAAASAHAVLESTTPPAGSALTAAPTRIELRFGEAVAIPTGAIRLLDASGEPIDVGNAHHVDGKGNEIAASVPTLPSGTYVVAWKAVSADSHPVHGAFTFSVGAPSGNAAGLVAEYQEARGSRVVGLTYGSLRSIGYGAAALLIGGFALIAWCWPTGSASSRARRWLCWAGGIGAVAALASIPVQAAYGESDGVGQVLDPSLWSEVMAGRFGWAALARAAAFGVGAIVAARLDRGRTAVWSVAAAAAVVIASSFALAGHGATGRWPLAGTVFDIVHVVAFSIWLGGLVGLAAWVLRDDVGAQESARATRRFSAVAVGAVVAVVLSGGAQGLRQVGWSWTALSTTTYGRLVMAKVAVVLVVLVIAWISRRHLGRLVDATSGSESTDRRDAAYLRRLLRRSVTLETAGLAVVVAISVVLSVTIPSGEAVAVPFDTVVRDGDATAQISISPARPGTNEIHVTVFGTAGSIPDLADLSAALELPSRDLGPIRVPMTEITSNHYLADAAVIPLPGDWQLTVEARIGDFDQERFEVTVPVS